MRVALSAMSQGPQGLHKALLDSHLPQDGFQASTKDGSLQSDLSEDLLLLLPVPDLAGEDEEQILPWAGLWGPTGTAGGGQCVPRGAGTRQVTLGIS